MPATNQRRKSGFNKLDELPTAADYIAAGAAPLLIMVMVGALVWFAQDLVYRGEHALRLRWTLFWFVIGMVGISRIAIERTPAYAGLFALGLGGAVAILISQFFVMPITGWLLLALIWWCTNKLVWDCTLLEEKEDASGEGLLEIAGMDETAGNGPRADVAVTHIAAGQRKPVALAWWRRIFLNRASRAGRPHAPGLWIIYFSLAALPLFGLGQAMLTRAQRSSPGLILLTVYLAAATGLLLLTSFLGLRRYLRQRRLTMPTTIATTWIGVGACIVVGVVAFSFLLPRPLTSATSSPASSALAGRKLDEKSPLADPQADALNATAQSQSEAATDAGDQGKAAGQQAAKEESAAGNQSGGSQVRDAIAERAGQRPMIQLPPPPDWLRWMGWALVAGAVLYLTIRYWREIRSAISELISSLRSLFQTPGKPRSRRAAPRAPGAGNTQPALRFADLRNPFRSGETADPAEVVQRTYVALECWAAERGAGRSPDMTPTEFARHLMTVHPGLGSGIRALAAVYAGLTYADRTPQAAELPRLAELWTELERSQ